VSVFEDAGRLNRTVYVFDADPSCAVTTTEMLTLAPALTLTAGEDAPDVTCVPATVMREPDAEADGTNTSDATELGSATVYDITLGENVGESTPCVSLMPDKVASAEMARVTLIA
jgi:hypothetical protein